MLGYSCSLLPIDLRKSPVDSYYAMVEKLWSIWFLYYSQEFARKLYLFTETQNLDQLFRLSSPRFCWTDKSELVTVRKFFLIFPIIYPGMIENGSLQLLFKHLKSNITTPSIFIEVDIIGDICWYCGYYFLIPFFKCILQYFYCCNQS